MAIRRTRRNPTLIANPRKRTRRKAGRRVARRAGKRNPRVASAWRKGSKSVARRNPTKGRRRVARRRNPGLGSFNVAGLPVISVALGTAGAIALISGVAGIPFIKTQIDKGGTVGGLVGPALVFAAGWAATKYVKNPMVKDIGKYACLAALVIAVQNTAGAAIQEQVTKMLPDTSPVKGLTAGTVSGAYLPLNKGGFSGAYVQAPAPTKSFGARSFG